MNQGPPTRPNNGELGDFSLAGKEGKPDIGVTFHIDFYRPIPKEIYDKHKEDLHGA